MQKLKTKERENCVSMNSNGELMLKLNEDLSSKISNSEEYKAQLTQFKYDNPQLKVELSGVANLTKKSDNTSASYLVIEESKNTSFNDIKQCSSNRSLIYPVFFPELSTPYNKTKGNPYISMGANFAG